MKTDKIRDLLKKVNAALDRLDKATYMESVAPDEGQRRVYAFDCRFLRYVIKLRLRKALEEGLGTHVVTFDLETAKDRPDHWREAPNEPTQRKIWEEEYMAAAYKEGEPVFGMVDAVFITGEGVVPVDAESGIGDKFEFFYKKKSYRERNAGLDCEDIPEYLKKPLVLNIEKVRERGERIAVGVEQHMKLEESEEEFERSVERWENIFAGLGPVDFKALEHVVLDNPVLRAAYEKSQRGADDNIPVDEKDRPA